MLDAILYFFASLITITAGLIVLLMWVVAILVVIDEIIDLVISYRNRNEEDR